MNLHITAALEQARAVLTGQTPGRLARANAIAAIDAVLRQPQPVETPPTGTFARLVQLASEQYDREGNAPEWALIVASRSDELVP